MWRRAGRPISVSDLGANLDRSSAPGPDLRAAAVAYLTRNGCADLLPALGLTEAGAAPGLPDAYRTPSGYFACRVCKRRTRVDGICRRSDCHRGEP